MKDDSDGVVVFSVWRAKRNDLGLFFAGICCGICCEFLTNAGLQGDISFVSRGRHGWVTAGTDVDRPTAGAPAPRRKFIGGGNQRAEGVISGQ